MSAPSALSEPTDVSDLVTVPLEAFGTTNSLVVTRPEVAQEAAPPSRTWPRSIEP